MVTFYVKFSYRFFTPNVLFLLLIGNRGELFHVILIRLRIIFRVLMNHNKERSGAIYFPFRVRTIIRHTTPMKAQVISTSQLRDPNLQIMLPMKRNFLHCVIVIRYVLHLRVIHGVPLWFRSTTYQFLFIYLYTIVFISRGTIIAIMVPI